MNLSFQLSLLLSPVAPTPLLFFLPMSVPSLVHPGTCFSSHTSWELWVCFTRFKDDRISYIATFISDPSFMIK